MLRVPIGVEAVGIGTWIVREDDVPGGALEASKIEGRLSGKERREIVTNPFELGFRPGRNDDDTGRRLSRPCRSPSLELDLILGGRLSLVDVVEPR